MWRKRGRAAWAAGLGTVVAVGGVLAPGGSSAQDWGGQGDWGEERTEYGALVCYELAEEQTSLESWEALRLCRGATSSAPAECFIAATPPNGMLSELDAIELCRCAHSLEPVGCYERADEQTFLDTWQIIQLCGPSAAQGLGFDCQPVASPLYPLLPPYQ